MWSTRRILAFTARSATLGLAAAFIAVLLWPELVHLRPVSSEPQPLSYADAVGASAPAVASIYTTHNIAARDSPFGIPMRGGELGSGVLISQEGYVVTNWHVIRRADDVRVQLADGRVAVPRVVGADPETELALLHIDLPDLPSIRLGRSDTLQPGDVVLAIGNSLGLSQTVTMGIVSATGRGQLGVTTFEDFIQTDAAINRGNSGGALINTRGELVGINTAILSATPRDPVPEGIGFAIPVNLVRGVMSQLIEHGRVIRGYLGVEICNLPLHQARALGLDGPAVLLERVSGPAAAAGLMADDVITHINGERMLSSHQAMNLVASAQPGDRIRIRIARVGAGPFETEAVLTERTLERPLQPVPQLLECPD